MTPRLFSSKKSTPLKEGNRASFQISQKNTIFAPIKFNMSDLIKEIENEKPSELSRIPMQGKRL